MHLRGPATDPLLPELHSYWTQVGPHQIHARSGGTGSTGPRVVLVHGIGISGRYLLPTARRLARLYDVYVPDLPGFGKSSDPPRALDVPELADALAAWMRDQELHHCVVVANSFGCQIVADLALRHPELVQACVLLGPTVDRHARSGVRQGVRLFLDTLREPVTLWAVEAYDSLVFGPLRFARTLRYMLRDRIEEKLPLIGVPVVVVRGQRDRIVPDRWVRELVDLAPRGRAETIPRAAHAVNFNSPEAVAGLVTRLIDELSSETATPLEDRS